MDARTTNNQLMNAEDASFDGGVDASFDAQKGFNVTGGFVPFATQMSSFSAQAAAAA